MGTLKLEHYEKCCFQISFPKVELGNSSYAFFTLHYNSTKYAFEIISSSYTCDTYHFLAYALNNNVYVESIYAIKNIYF